MVDRPGRPRPFLRPAMDASARTPATAGAGNVYANVRARPRQCRMCGRDLPVPEPGTPGQRARYCETCKQVREALRFARAAVRRLEAIVPPAMRMGAAR